MFKSSIKLCQCHLGRRLGRRWPFQCRSPDVNIVDDDGSVMVSSVKDSLIKVHCEEMEA